MKTLYSLLLSLTLSAYLFGQQNTTAPAKAEPTSTSVTESAKRKAPQPQPDGTVKIDITLGELFVARYATVQGTQSPLDKLFSLDLPVKTALSLRKTLAAIDNELKPFNDQRAELFKKYGKPKEGTRIVPPENMEAFSSDINVLFGIHTELIVTQVPLSVFGESLKLSANDLARLEQFLVADIPKSEEKSK